MTSRTNITEALAVAMRQRFRRHGVPLDSWTDEMYRFEAMEIVADMRLAAEPRSDAVTAPDEPSLRHAAKNVLDLIDNGTEGGDGDTPLYDLLADEAREDVEVLRSVVMDESRLTAYERGWRDGVREARAASASVPPLDENFIWLHPGRYSGEPCIGGHRIPTEVIAELVSAGDDGQTIIDGYDITRTQVILACWYEARHGQRRNWGDWLNDWEPAMWRGDFDDVPLPAAETPEQGRGDE